MEGMASEEEIRRKFEALCPILDERGRRLWAGVEAEHSDGGIAAVERATGMSRTTIRAGRDELRPGVDPEDVVNVRRSGAGRPPLEEGPLTAEWRAHYQRGGEEPRHPAARDFLQADVVAPPRGGLRRTSAWENPDTGKRCAGIHHVCRDRRSSETARGEATRTPARRSPRT